LELVSAEQAHVHAHELELDESRSDCRHTVTPNKCYIPFQTQLPAKVSGLQRKAIEATSAAANSNPTALIPTPTSTTATNQVVIQAFAGQLPQGMDTREYMSSGASLRRVVPMVQVQSIES
jgi:hypothetical protein